MAMPGEWTLILPDPPKQATQTSNHPTQMKGGHSYKLGEFDHKDPESSVGQDHVPLDSEDGRWESQPAPKSGEMLPWPGTLAAVSRNTKPGGSGFNPPSTL